MRLVVMASPYAGDIEGNLEYARLCLRDSLLRGEAPIAGHLLYTQTGVLDDHNISERAHGMAAGHEWIRAADVLIVYTDKGISTGMYEDIEIARQEGVEVVFRKLEPINETDQS